MEELPDGVRLGGIYVVGIGSDRRRSSDVAGRPALAVGQDDVRRVAAGVLVGEASGRARSTQIDELSDGTRRNLFDRRRREVPGDYRCPRIRCGPHDLEERRRPRTTINRLGELGIKRADGDERRIICCCGRAEGSGQAGADRRQSELLWIEL